MTINILIDFIGTIVVVVILSLIFRYVFDLLGINEWSNGYYCGAISYAVVLLILQFTK